MFIKLKDIPEPCVEQMKSRHVFLTEDNKRGWRNKNNSPTNLLIEGENYHALRMLEYTHASEIDVIYLDSPYNTGHNDFVYQDDFTVDVPDGEEGDAHTGTLAYVNAEDPSRHSKWVSFMERRLRIARELLSERGVIFMSIDDNEMAHLKLLCDAVFGEQNFVNNIIWVYENSTMKNPKRELASKHEYVLCYAKNKSQFEINKIREDEVSEKLIKRFGRYANENGEILFKDVQNETSYLSRMVPKFIKENGRNPEANDVIDVLKGNYIRDVVNIPGCRTNELKSKYDIDFDYPKPVALIKLLISLASAKDSIVLDFFAGSGTTGQAVAELNREDGGTRQFILCTNNEKSEKLPNGIARDATYPRLQKTVANDTNLAYMKVCMLKHENTQQTCLKVSQLELQNRMLALLKLKFNAYHTIEETDKYVILNGRGNYHLGVYFNHTDKQTPFGSVRGSFQEYLDKYSNNNDVVFNFPSEGYATEYFKFIQTTNPK